MALRKRPRPLFPLAQPPSQPPPGATGPAAAAAAAPPPPPPPPPPARGAAAAAPAAAAAAAVSQQRSRLPTGQQFCLRLCPQALLQLLRDTFIERTRCTLGKLKFNALQYLCRHGIEIHCRPVLVCVFVRAFCNESTQFVPSMIYMIFRVFAVRQERRRVLLPLHSHNLPMLVSCQVGPGGGPPSGWDTCDL